MDDDTSDTGSSHADSQAARARPDYDTLDSGRTSRDEDVTSGGTSRRNTPPSGSESEAAGHNATWVSPLTPDAHRRPRSRTVAHEEMRPIAVAHAPSPPFDRRQRPRHDTTHRPEDDYSQRTHRDALFPLTTAPLSHSLGSSRTSQVDANSLYRRATYDSQALADAEGQFGLSTFTPGAPTPSRSPLDQPDEVLLAMLRRGHQLTSQPLSTSQPRSSVNNAINMSSATHLSQSTSSLQARLERTRLHESERSVAREAARSKLESDEAWRTEIAQLKRAHADALDAKERAHTYEQADLLTAFQSDRADSEKKAQIARADAEKKSQAAVTALRQELASMEQNLAAHQALYTDYTQQIQLELASLKREITESQQTIRESQQTIREHETRAASQDTLIATMNREHESMVTALRQEVEQHMVERQQQLEQHIMERQQEAEQAALDRQRWERELIQHSNSVLVLKQESFEMERTERDQIVHTLTHQLETQTAARVDLEKKFSDAETKRKEAAANIEKLEGAVRSDENMLRAQRDLNNDVSRAYAELEKAHQTSQHESQVLGSKLRETEREYQRLEIMYSQMNEDGGERLQYLQQENTHLHEVCTANRRAVEGLDRDLKKSTLDRLALQHSFVRLRAKARLQKLMCHWICITQARKYRNREMHLLILQRARRMKIEALQRWFTNARLVTSRLQTADALAAHHDHFAVRFHERSLQQAKVKAFHAWANGRAQDRALAPRQATPSASAVDVEVERSKKIELFHLLQRERAQWQEAKQSYEQQLQAREAARQEEAAETHRALATLQADHQRQADAQPTHQRTNNGHRPSSHQPSPAVTSRSRIHPSSSPVVPAPTFTPVRLTSPSRSVLPSPAVVSTPGELTLQKQDLQHLIQDIHAHSSAHAKQAELHGLQESITNEQSRLALLTKLRQEREAAELAQTHRSPSRIQRSRAHPVTGDTVSSAAKKRLSSMRSIAPTQLRPHKTVQFR